jgi:hypothetical protein
MPAASVGGSSVLLRRVQSSDFDPSLTWCVPTLTTRKAELALRRSDGSKKKYTPRDGNVRGGVKSPRRCGPPVNAVSWSRRP